MKIKRGKLMPYFPRKGLIEAIEIARFLKKPLLLRGEPGSGKTRFAEALAFEMYENEYKDYLFTWNIKSTTTVNDGLYFYDAIKRLQESQLPEYKGKHLNDYIDLKQLGKAFEKSTPEKPTILLIDEIDKADIDFPNDLLDELDLKEGNKILIKDSIDRKIVIKYPPIVIITSNNEKELPPAFLRRCVFHYIDNPSKDELVEIGKAFISSYGEKILEDDEIRTKVDKYLQIREDMEERITALKKPSTSEFLDWLFTYTYYKYNENITEDTEEKLRFPGVLFKTAEDYKAELGGSIE